MKILITGAGGFIGKNLAAELKNQGYDDLLLVTRETAPEVLEEYCRDCEFVYHLAGVNRSERAEDFMEGNFGLLRELVERMNRSGNNAPLLFASSIQAERENPYGNSKRAAEEYLQNVSEKTGRRTLIYRLGNVYGKWCRPNYNSVVATFCHNIARDLPIQINDPNASLNLLYIDDVVAEFIAVLKGMTKRCDSGYYFVALSEEITLGRLAELLYSFRESRKNLSLPDMKDKFTRELYATYLSYLPEREFAYPLKMNLDARGSFTEFLRTEDRGQVSVNISKPGITKGNHWHHTKNEKFLVVRGEGIIRFRRLDTDEVIEYRVNGDELQVVDIPTGYTHNITNTGTDDMVTIMWASEPFDPERPDTYFLEV